jgi:crossover junction endodeoxyribonuclease RuvC
MTIVMRILGIDPGTRVVGYGIIEEQGSKLLCVTYGAIKTSSDAMAERLLEIHDGLNAVIEEHVPGIAAIEDAFFHKDVKSAIKIGQGRGAAMIACARGGLEVTSYPPATIKKAVTGNGRAAKEQVRAMVMQLLGVREKISPLDATDALSIAICHAFRAQGVHKHL